MSINWVLPVRGVQLVLSIVVLGLMGYVANWWTTHWRQMSPAEVNFMIFSPVWSLLAGIVLIIVPMKFARMAEQTIPKILLLVLELFTVVFWFSGFIALAVFLHDRICFGTVCSVAKAGTAISALAWLAWFVTFVMAMVRLFFRRGRLTTGSAGEPELKVEMHQGV